MGSGVYSGRQGPINYVYDDEASNGTLLVGNLPCNGSAYVEAPTKTPIATTHHIKYEDLSEFLGIRLDDINGTVSACQGTLCCQATYTQTSIPNDDQAGRYMLVIHQGNVSEDDLYTLSAEICSVLWCPDGELNTCTFQPANITSSFVYLEFHGTFSNTTYVYPSVLTSDLQLAPNNQWHYEPLSSRCPNDSSVRCSELEIVPQEGPLSITTAVLYGRQYELDPPSN